MAYIVVVALICVTLLIGQYRDHVYRGMNLDARVEALEKRQAIEFDPKDYAELKTQVQALRIAKGLR